MSPRAYSFLAVALIAVAVSMRAPAARGTPRSVPSGVSDSIPAGEWHHYHRDLASTRYSPLDRIGPENLDRLETAWTWTADSLLDRREFKNESTPLMIDGVLYFTTGTERVVVAADAGTGETLWSWKLDEGARAEAAPRANSGRGVAYWAGAASDQAAGGAGAAGGDAAGTTGGPDAAAGPRIFVVTPGFHLVALDAATGDPVESFGQGGIVDLKLLLGVELDPETAPIGSSSPPLIFEDVVVIGPALEVGLRPPSRRNVPGRILAVDARTGELRWRFNTIPLPGEFGNDTWEDGSWEYTGNAGAWAPLTLDEERGYLYLPVEAATGDYYGGHRPGDNLFSTSLVCLDVRSGERIWHYQIIHHEIWDRDLPTAPILADLVVDGRPVEAVVQITKQAFTYVFDRVTGAPVWPIVETPVPASDVPGERTSPTQPIPTKPPPFDRQGVTIDDLIDFTPELHAEAVEAAAAFRLGELFSPASLRDAPDGTRGTLHLPGTLGGANWEHGAFDPETGMLYVGSYTSPSVIALASDPERSDMDYVMVGGRVPRVQGLPIIKPPYGRITAIDLNRGEHAWMVANGDTPEEIREHPALQGLEIPPTGSMARPVVLATRTLLFAGEGWGGEPVLHAYDKATGEELWRMELPGVISSQPMTYLHEGRQYLAFWMGDVRAGVPATLVALRL